MESLPVDLVVEPGEYLCDWELPESSGSDPEVAPKTYPGRLVLKADGMPTGEVHGPLPLEWVESNGSSSASLPQVVAAAEVVAKLANGLTAKLVDVEVEYWAPNAARVSAAAAVVGRAVAAVGTAANKVIFQVGALDALMGTSPIESFKIPDPQALGLTGTWSFIGDPSSALRWKGNTAELSAEFQGKISVGDEYRIAASFSPVATFSLSRPVGPVESVLEWVDVVRGIVTIATGASQPINFVLLEWVSDRGPGEPKRRRRGQLFGAGVTQQPFASRKRDVLNARSAMHVHQDSVDLLDLVTKWQELMATGHPLMETYAAMLHARDQHPRSRFLLLMQALEGLHGNQHEADRKVADAEHRSKRAEVLAALKENPSVDPSIVSFIKRQVSNRPIRSFAGALRDVLADLPVDQRPAIEASELVVTWKAEESPSSSLGPIDILGKVRNDLAHGNRSHDLALLQEVVVILDNVVRAHLMRLLGCPDVVLERLLHEGAA